MGGVKSVEQKSALYQKEHKQTDPQTQRRQLYSNLYKNITPKIAIDFIILISPGKLKKKITLTSSISEGETGGLSVKEPLRGPLLWESLPEVRGDTSCCINRPHELKKRCLIA